MKGAGETRCIGGILKGTVEDLLAAVERQPAAEGAAFQQAAAADLAATPTRMHGVTAATKRRTRASQKEAQKCTRARRCY